MLILMLLGLIKPWIFIIVVEICEILRTIQLAPLIAVNYGGSLIFFNGRIAMALPLARIIKLLIYWRLCKLSCVCVCGNHGILNEKEQN